jgi:hypothetical protein
MSYFVFKTEPSFRASPLPLTGPVTGPQKLLCEGHFFAVKVLKVDTFLKEFEVDYGNTAKEGQDDHNFGYLRIAAGDVQIRTHVKTDPTGQNVFFDVPIKLECGDDTDFDDPYQGTAQVVLIMEH